MAFWVFGYGSLLWNPGFSATESVRAVLPGYHRSFCMLSIHHRGTEEEPGLVLALDEADATCTGLALKVHPDEAEKVLAELRERELVSSAYLEKTVQLQADDGRSIDALAYVINRDHRQYVQYELERQAQMIARAVGGRGPNPDYLFNTADLLRDLKIKDADMDWLVTRVREIAQNA